MSNVIKGYSIQDGEPTPDNSVEIESLDIEDIKFIDEMIKEYNTFGDLDNTDYEDTDKIYKAIENILKKIKELEEENEKYKYLYQKALDNTASSDRENIQLKEQIDLMAEYISKIDIEEDICIKNKTNQDWCNEDYTNCKDCIKQYFERKSEE